MDLRFIAPDLRQIDTVGAEVLACALFSDQFPPRGVVGLVDWRMAARLSRYLEFSQIAGHLGEAVLIPGKPRIPFEKLLLFGAGPSVSFDETAYVEVISRMLQALDGLKVRMAVVERPGRDLRTIDAARAVELLLRTCSDQGGQDAWTLIETIDDQKAMSLHLAEERRRKRMR